jgi:hypothetical protein
VRSGLTAVIVPSACRVRVQPQWCTAMRWWKAQSRTRLPRLVWPPLARVAHFPEGALSGYAGTDFPTFVTISTLLRRRAT